MAGWAEGKRVAMLIADDFEDREATEPLSFMREHGAEVVVIGLERRVHRGKRGAKVSATATFEDSVPEEFDLLVIPGGRAPEKLRIEDEVLDFVRGFWGLSRPVAAICHGPQVLMSAGLMEGKRATCWKGIRDDLRLAGAEYEDEPVVIDGLLITSRQPSDIPLFNQAIEQMMAEQAAA